MKSNDLIRQKIIKSFSKEKMRVIHYADVIAIQIKLEEQVFRKSKVYQAFRKQTAHRNHHYHYELKRILNRVNKCILFKKERDKKGVIQDSQIKESNYYNLNKAVKIFKTVSAELLGLIDTKVLKSKEAMDHNFRVSRRIDKGLVAADFPELRVFDDIAKIKSARYYLGHAAREAAKIFDINWV